MAMAGNNIDWQVGLRSINQRANKMLNSGKLSDCVFIVGTENRQESVQAHQLILAMTSPVFEAMFFGSMADKDDKPIEILDVQPQAFKALLKYIYGDEINFTSFDQVCEICYAAKKYMIPPLVEECTKFIWKDLRPDNVCRAYAFVRLFEEPQLLEKCMSMIKTLTGDIIRDPSFEEVDTSTLKSILSQDTLNASELEIWNGVLRWSEHECGRQSLEVNPTNQRKVMIDLLPLIRFLTLSPTQFANGPALSNILTQEEGFCLLLNISSPGVATTPPLFSSSTVSRKPQLPPQCSSSSSRQSQSFRPSQINLYVDSDELCEGQLHCNCAGPLADIFVNDQLVDCSLSFSVDCDSRIDIGIVGVILPTQLKPQGAQSVASKDLQDEWHQNFEVRSWRRPTSAAAAAAYQQRHPIVNKYPELIYAFLQDSDGSRLTYTHFSALVSWEGTMEVLFNRPISVLPNKTYKIVVVLNKMGRYPLYTILSNVPDHDDVNFSFDHTPIRESVVKALIFKKVKRPTRSPDNLSPHWGHLEL